MRRIAGIYLIALAGVASFLILMVLSFGELRSMVRQLSDNTGENMVWMVSQTMREVLRLAVVIERGPSSAQGWEALDFRLDMLASRLQVISDPPLREVFTRYGLEQDFEDFTGALQRLTHSLAHAPVDISAQDRQALAQEAEAIALKSSAMTNAIMLKEREHLGAQYDSMRAANEWLLASSLAAMLLGLGMGLWLLRSLVRQTRVTRELREHQEGLEMIVAERTRALNEALTTERHAKEIYHSFITTVSHQFRTPLAVINMIGQRLKRRADQFSPEQLLQKAESVTTATSRLLELLASINRAAQSDRVLSFNPAQAIDMYQLCQKVIGEMHSLGYAREITLTAAADLPAVVADPGLMAEVIENLLSNAIKYSDFATPIHLDLTAQDGCLVGTVTDRGMGIPPEDQPRIFERFHRGSNVARLFGSGLGLSLSRTVLKLHRGDLSFTSDLGQGSVFTFRLPLEGCDAA